MEEDERRERARAHVQKLRGFYVHLAIYLIVNAGLAGLNLVAGPPHWFVWPALGWGIGLLAHGLSVSQGRFLGPEWEERKIREHHERERNEGR